MDVEPTEISKDKPVCFLNTFVYFYKITELEFLKIISCGTDGNTWAASGISFSYIRIPVDVQNPFSSG